jgi:hypothetical protein
MKSKHILAGGALTGVIALSTPVFAGPLGGITGAAMGGAGFGGIAGGALGATALGSPITTLGAAGSAGAMATGAADAAGSIGTAANGHFAGDAAGAVSANPDALKPLATHAERAGGRAAGNAQERVQGAHDAAFSEVDSVQAAALSARQSARRTVNAGSGTALNAVAGTAAKGRETASSRLSHRAGSVSGNADGGISASGGAQASGGSDDSVRADGSANAQVRAGASMQ